MTTPVTRFAPSPNGPLHLGHAYAAIVAHDRARRDGGEFLLRIEDIDGVRSRAELADEFRADLAWLGLTWGEVMPQSQRIADYQAAFDRLRAMGLVYPCYCTRAEIAGAATRSGPDGPVYPGTCRGLHGIGTPTTPVHPEPVEGCAPNLPGAQFPDTRIEGSARPSTGSGRTGIGDPGTDGAELVLGRDPVWRIDMAAAMARTSALTWHDERRGRQIARPDLLGDVVLWRKDAPASYHLAATVDDAADGVSVVTRGADLFAATHVHRVLQALLGLPEPVWHHHPVLVEADGRKLAKRRGAPGLGDRRRAGESGAALAAALRAGQFDAGICLSEYLDNHP